MSNLKEYMLDSFHEGGTITENGQLLEEVEFVANTLDQNTRREQIDLSMIYILHRIGEFGDKQCFASIVPGTELYRVTPNGFKFVPPEMMYVRTSDMPESLLQEIVENEEGCSTAFYVGDTCSSGDLSKIYFTSKFLAKTLIQRTPVGDEKSSLERDLLLGWRSVYGNNPQKEDECVVNAVIRTDSGISKIFAFFGNGESNRLGFSQMIDLAKSINKGDVLAYDVTQKGMQFVYACKDSKENRDGLLPCYAFTVCDTGFSSNSIAPCWYNRKNGAYFTAQPIPFCTQDQFFKEKLLDKVQAIHQSAAQKVEKDIKKKVSFKTQEEFARQIKKIVSLSGNVGKKTADDLVGKNNLEFMVKTLSESYRTGEVYTINGLKNLIMDTLFVKASPYKKGVLQSSLLSMIRTADVDKN